MFIFDHNSGYEIFIWLMIELHWKFICFVFSGCTCPSCRCGVAMHCIGYPIVFALRLNWSAIHRFRFDACAIVRVAHRPFGMLLLNPVLDLVCSVAMHPSWYHYRTFQLAQLISQYWKKLFFFFVELSFLCSAQRMQEYTQSIKVACKAFISIEMLTDTHSDTSHIEWINICWKGAKKSGSGVVCLPTQAFYSIKVFQTKCISDQLKFHFAIFTHVLHVLMQFVNLPFDNISALLDLFAFLMENLLLLPQNHFLIV